MRCDACNDFLMILCNKTILSWDAEARCLVTHLSVLFHKRTAHVVDKRPWIRCMQTSAATLPPQTQPPPPWTNQTTCQLTIVSTSQGIPTELYNRPWQCLHLVRRSAVMNSSCVRHQFPRYRALRHLSRSRRPTTTSCKMSKKSLLGEELKCSAKSTSS